MSFVLQGRNVPIRSWAPPNEIDPNALKQLKAIAALPWVAHHVAVMPDVDVGTGATVGSVIAMRAAISPAAVGVDIGCGMAALETSLCARELPDDLRALRLAIEAAIPVGGANHRDEPWQDAPTPLREKAIALLQRIPELAPTAHRSKARASLQLSTLGGGNHFIEVCLDDEERVWLMLHSGSRNIGATLAEHHMEVARRLEHNQALIDPDLAAFLAGTRVFDAYRRDLGWAQDYAALNRELMMMRLERLFRTWFPHIEFGLGVTCHHNYVSEERHFGEELLVTRKGAIYAGAGALGIIPGSMGARSYIVRGLGNPMSFESASHGAGRRMSRGQARKSYTVLDLARQTEGVECRKDAGVIDEAPKAYKDIQRVMAAQSDLVEIVRELKQVICVKG